MNLSENISFALGRGINTRQKIPVLILAITILAKAGEAIFWLLYGIFDASFFQIFVNIFSVLFTLAFVALAVYIALLFLSNKKPIYLITVIFFVVYILAGESVLRYLSMPIIVLCLCFPSLGDGSNEHRSCTKLAIISAVVAIVIKLLQGIIAFDISFRLAYSLGFFTASFDGFALLMSLPCLILSAENTGGVGSAVKFLSAEGEKLGSKLAERSGEMVSIAKEKGVGIGKFSRKDGSSSEPVSSGTHESNTGTGHESGSAIDELSSLCFMSGGHNSGCKYQYKSIAGPVGLAIDRKGSYADGVKKYAAIIDRETVGGWYLDSIQEIPVTKRAGCLARLFGQPDITVFLNMLIFRKED